MFDFRYHALSLAGVFIALVVGLLLGVAIGDRELVSSARNDLRDSIRGDVIKADGERDDALAALRREQDYARQVFPIVAANRLRGRHIGLIVLGSAGKVDDIVADTLKPTGATLQAVAIVRDDVDTGDLAKRARGTRYAELSRAPSLLDAFAVRMGVQMVQGGKLLGAERTALVRSLSGSFGGLDGVVVARNGTPPKDKAAAARQHALYDGLARGLVGSDVPVVGVETFSQKPSQVGWYRDHDMSSVDNLDEDAGQAALVFVLAGSDGAWGRKSTAQDLLPPVVGH